MEDSFELYIGRRQAALASEKEKNLSSTTSVPVVYHFQVRGVTLLSYTTTYYGAALTCTAVDRPVG